MEVETVTEPEANPELPTLNLICLTEMFPPASAVTVTSPILFSAPRMRPVCWVELTVRVGFEATSVMAGAVTVVRLLFEQLADAIVYPEIQVVVVVLPAV